MSGIPESRNHTSRGFVSKGTRRVKDLESRNRETRNRTRIRESKRVVY